MARRVRSRVRSRARRGSGLLGPRRVAYNPKTGTWIVIERQPDGRWKIIGNYEDQATAKRLARGMFYRPRRYKYLADIVRIDSVENAREAVRKLWEEFREAKTYAKKLRIARATLMAANIASVFTRRRNLSPEERSEKAEVERIYRGAANRMFEELRELRASRP